MEDVKKSIFISQHAKEQIIRRGSSECEIIDAIKGAEWKEAQLGRLECLKEFKFEKEWNGKYYSKKQVRPIFVDEKDSIVVVTVYVYYS